MKIGDVSGSGVVEFVAETDSSTLRSIVGVLQDSVSSDSEVYLSRRSIYFELKSFLNVGVFVDALNDVSNEADIICGEISLTDRNKHDSYVLSYSLQNRTWELEGVRDNAVEASTRRVISALRSYIRADVFANGAEYVKNKLIYSWGLEKRDLTRYDIDELLR